jgi:hypothetical protein
MAEDSVPPLPEVAPKTAPISCVKRGSCLPLLVSLLALVAALSQPLWVARLYPDKTVVSAESSEQVMALQSEINMVKASVAALPAPANTEDLRQKIDGLQRDLAALAGRLAVLETHAVPAVTPTQLTELQNRMDQLVVQQGKASQDSTAEKVFASAALQLVAAWQGGLPFDAPWLALVAAAETASPDLVVTLNDVAPVLLPWRTQGLPRLSQLETGFSEAAKAALVASQPVGESWWQQSLNHLKGLVVIRRTDAAVPADEISVEATLARAQSRWQAGDLAAAIDLVASLTGAPAEVMAKWLEGARARLRADGLAATLSAQVAAQLTPATAPEALP